MTFQRIFANNYLVKDAVVEANVDLYGGPSATMADLHSIRAVDPKKYGIDSDFDSLVAYLAEQIVEEKKWRTIVVLHDHMVIYSTGSELRRGDRTGTRVQQISGNAAIGFSIRQFLRLIREMFRR